MCRSIVLLGVKGRVMLDPEVRRHVTAGPDDAFRFVADGFFKNHQRWDPAVTMEIASPGPVAVGSEGTETRRFLGRQVAGVRVTGFDRPRRFAFTNTSGPFALDRSFSFEPDGGGTLLVFTFTMRPRPLPLRIMFPLLKRIIARQVEQNIDRLAGILDGQAITSESPAAARSIDRQ
jgi:Polyketide cyclase / dehydrase and lipid transport